MLTKVFGIVTPNYTKIELSILYRAVDLLVKSAELGKTEVSYWRVDQDYAEIRVEFPDAADGYTAAYGLPNRIVPGLRLSAGDTGHASVQVEPTYRVDSSLAIGDESVRKVHRGEITEESILEDIDTKVLTRLKSFPEALIDRLGVSIGSFDLTNNAGRRENRKLILKCIKEGMKTLGINKVLGTKRKKVVIEKLKREIDPLLHYTEYDIALILMGLAERVHLESREVAIRLAKACGKAASVPPLRLFGFYFSSGVSMTSMSSNSMFSPPIAQMKV